MATIESVWDLRLSSAPRSVAVVPAPAPVPPSASGGGTSSSRGGGYGTANHNSGTNPFASPSSSADRLGASSGSGGTSRNNPFDDAATSTYRSGGGNVLRKDGSGADLSSSGGGGGTADADADASSSVPVSLIVGTDRGALHRRTYGTNASAAPSESHGALSSVAPLTAAAAAARQTVLPMGYGSSTSTSDGGGGGGGGSSSSSSAAASVHPSHRPIDLTSAVPGPIVQIAPTEAIDLKGFALPPPTHSLTSAAAAYASPVLLVLVDDGGVVGVGGGGGEGSSSSSSSLGVGDSDRSAGVAAAAVPNSSGSAGSYAVHLLTTARGSASGSEQQQQQQPQRFDRLQSVKLGDPLLSDWSASAPVLPPLPRATCASYHPHTGYVCAMGSSVLSLPPAQALAVAYHLAGMSGKDDGGRGGTGRGGQTLSSSDRRGGGGGGSGGGLLSAMSHRAGHGHGFGHGQQQHPPTSRRQEQQRTLLRAALPRIVFDARNVLPAASSGVRSGPDALCLTCGGRVAVVASRNDFFAVSGRAVVAEDYFKNAQPDAAAAGGSSSQQPPPTKVLSFAASGRVHPAVVVEIPLEEDGARASSASAAKAVDDEEVSTSLLFLASGKECAAVEILHDPRFVAPTYLAISSTYSEDSTGGASSTLQGPVTAGPPRNGIATLASPILAAVGLAGHSGRPPLVAILTTDGIVQTRSPSCLGVPLTTVEVGTRPNDFFSLRSLSNGSKLVAASHSGEGRVLALRPESDQDMADRLMTLSIDAFGPATFPRTELSEAISASYGATSYAGHSEPTVAARALLRQYLEAILGLVDGFASDQESDDGKNKSSIVTTSSTLLCGTALLCKVTTILSRPNTTLANRAAKACASKMGVGMKSIKPAAAKVCDIIADDMLALASADPSCGMALIEPAAWLLRACGLHGKAIDVVALHMNDAAARNLAGSGASGYGRKSSGWSQLRYESYLSSHLSDLWSSNDTDYTDLVLDSKTTTQLLELNPRLGLSIFTSGHPQSGKQWESTVAISDPLAHPTNPRKVVDLLMGARPSIPPQTAKIEVSDDVGDAALPLTSSRALAATFLESAIGLSTRALSDNFADEEEAFDALPSDTAFDERVADFHDEFAVLLLEGVLSERGDADERAINEENEQHTEISRIGEIYRSKLRRFLGWSQAKVRPDRLLLTLPPSFRRERALLLGRLGQHNEALRILYGDLRSLDMALEYCDVLYEQQQSKRKRATSNRSNGAEADAASGSTAESDGDPYLPLVKVALQMGDPKEGVDAAIKVMSMRRDVMDCGAALRVLPGDLPMSRIARPFLIPAVVGGGSEVRQMKIAYALLKARYVRLKRDLTKAQIESQANLSSVPALKALGLGSLIRSSKPFRARPVHASSSSSFPDVTIIKHFFPRYLVIQAKVSNSAISALSGEGRALSDIAFVVAESSDEALTPSATVPLKLLPTTETGSVWCALAASPQRLDDIAVIACELRYTVLSAGLGNFGHAFVEELQDLDVRPSDFNIN